MSGHKSHSRRGHERADSREGEDRDRHHHHLSSSSRDRDGQGRDSSRDGRDREHQRSRHSDSGRDGRPSSHTTPPKPPPPGGRPQAPRGPVLGGFLGSSVLEAAKAEAAKRKAAEAAAAAAAAASQEDSEEPGEVGARKKPKHEPIVWHSPPRKQGGSDAGDSRPPSQQETLQERLQREAAEFRQQQQQHLPDRPSSRTHRPSSRSRHRSSSPSSGRSRSRGRSPSTSPEEGARPRRHRRHSSSRSRSSSRGSSRSRSNSRQQRPAGARWQEEEEDEEQQQAKPAKSRWFAEEDDEEAGGGAGREVEEGEALGDGGVAVAIDEELEELNRRERAALAGEAGSDAEADDHLSPGADLTGDASGLHNNQGLEFSKNMLEESRRVEEYERLNRISEGTYGVVYRARCKSTGKIYALKKLKLENCPDGFPQTSVREINVLLSVHHENIVNVTEVVYGSRDSIFMVMEFVEHDLKYILELQHAKKALPFSMGQVKCLMKQLLDGVDYLHQNWVIHRDLKTSNLLYSNQGQLKICDFGLARQYGSPLRTFTPAVVTLWYRSIERLLGDPKYSTALDMWSVGCIMAELLTGEPLFQGKGELDQIKKIFALLGTPTQESWPGWDQLPDSKNLQWKPQESQLRAKFPTFSFAGSTPVLSEAGFDLLSSLLEMNPAKRISADKARAHKWFDEAPRPVNAALMPAFTERHKQGAGSDAGGFRDKLVNPSPGAVGPAGFGK